MKDDIISTIAGEIDSFIYDDLDMGGGSTHNQYKVIRRINQTVNSEYEDKSLYAGREKTYFNISVPHKDSILKFMDVDVADVRAVPRTPTAKFPSIFMDKELRYYLDDNGYSSRFNKLGDRTLTYGSVVLKHSKKSEPETIKMHNFFCDPGADNLQEARYVTVLRYLSPKQLREKIKDGWDKDAVERLIKSVENKKGPSQTKYLDERYMHQPQSTKQIEVYERYGEIDGEERLVVVGEPFLCRETEKQGTENVGEILVDMAWSKNRPFEEHHYEKIEGRWLGRGIIEKLFDIQERVNELANQKRVSMEISSMHIFQTADKTVLNNILSDIENGTVIKTKTQGALQPVANEERNLPAFQLEQNEYTALANRTTFSNDLVTGQDLPASTPATNVLIANNNAVKTHMVHRQNFVIFLRKYIENFVIKDFIRQIDTDHILRYAGTPEELKALNKEFTNIITMKSVKENMLAGIAPLKPFVEDIEVKVSKKFKEQGDARYTDVLKGYYRDNLDNISIVIDDENRDMATEANNIQQFLLSLNIDSLGDPVYRKFVSKYGELIGIDTYKLETAFNERMEDMPQGKPPRASKGQSQPKFEDQFLAKSA